MPARSIFGGPKSANDEEDFVRREIDWIAVPLKENKPFLGICLGGQMLARHLGGKVDFHPEGHVEVGYYPIRPTQAGRALCELGPTTSINGIAKASTCRAAATLLAEGDTFPVQAFRHGDMPMRSSSIRKSPTP